MHGLMKAALGKLSAMAKMYVPADIQSALLEYGAEIDRLRAEVIDLRSKINEKE
ncbi:hypothetical protein [Duganella radicis]|uniref:Uncharacterized protein n=1 Tax=Duganella radicis TaxID=551988 RepID=A0A6L6PCF4_9BURK|nr:hypothetical protein [Duganella radicis]MTV36271.1 hypothetical protein [Duganella radicis]